MTVSRERVGPYRVESELGRGGMGVVYKAYREGTKHPVALKLATDRASSGAASVRIERHTLARLRHPDIVAIHDHGEHEGLPWIAMEFLEGHTLDQWLGGRSASTTMSEFVVDAASSSSSPPEEFDPGATLDELPPLGEYQGLPATLTHEELVARMALVQRCCGALSYLHGEGVVHRDLKPANIFVRHDGSPVLVDFGMVQRFPAGGPREELALAEGPAGGSLEYAAPEQLQGGLIDARTDLYALGCIIFHMVTGRAPFMGSLHALIRQHLHTVPPRLRHLRPDLPEGLELLVSELLEKRREDRVGSAAGVAHRIEEVFAELAPDGSSAPHRRWLFRPALVGREHELQQLVQALSRHSGTALAIVGEPGIGRTRLVAEAAAQARQVSLRVSKGACLPTFEGAGAGGLRRPLEPLRPLLLAVADHCRQHPEAREELLPGSHANVLATVEPALTALGGERAPPVQSTNAARVRLLAWLRQCVVAWCQVQPVLLVIDDVHWADDLTEAFLAALVAEEPIPGLHLLLSSRPPLSEDLAAGTETVVLGPLRDDAIEAMAAGMLGMQEVAPGLGRLARQIARGRPLVLAELLHAAVELGVLHPTVEGGWAFDASAWSDGDALPKDAQGLLTTRIERLETTQRTIVEFLTRAYCPLSLSQLHTGTQLPEDLVYAALPPLMAHGLIDAHASGGIVATRQVVELEGKWAPDPAVHRRLAELLARTEPPDAGLVAEHWLRAGDPEAAWAWLIEAGIAAFESGDARQTKASLERALSHRSLEETRARLGPEVAHRLVRALLPSYVHLAEYDRAEDLASSQLSRLGHRLRRGRLGTAVQLLVDLTGLAWSQLRPPQPWTEDQAADGHAAMGLLSTLAAGHIGQARMLSAMASILASYRLSMRCRPGEEELETLAYYGLILGMMGFEKGSRRVLDRAYRAADAQPDRDRALVYAFDSLVALCRCNWAHFDHIVRPGLEAAHRSGTMREITYLHMNAAAAAVERGTPQMVLEDLPEAVRIAATYGYALQHSIMLSHRAHLHVLAGELQEARALLANLDDNNDEVHHGLQRGAAAVLLAIAEEDRPAARTALEVLDPLVCDRANRNPGLVIPAWRAAEGWLWLAEGSSDDERDHAHLRAMQMAKALRSVSRTNPAAVPLHAYLLARAALLSGNTRRAVRSLREALAKAQTLGLSECEATVRCMLARPPLGPAPHELDLARSICQERGLHWPLLGIPHTGKLQ